MEIFAAIFSIAIALTIGAMSPGPSFVMVARTALAVSRKDGLTAALGMGVGGVLFATIALLGLLTLLTAVPVLYISLKVLGGVYLIYLGYKIWQDSAQPVTLNPTEQQTQQNPVWYSFFLGLTTQISNPKTAVVYTSVFASLLPSNVPAFAVIALPIVVFIIEAGWYSLVALTLSATTPRSRYLASKKWLDRTAGTILSLLGAKLIFEANNP
ncbi:LysE family translocator [Leptolyngbyaceae cyanobacterium CCMR0082]|uniref:LysE family translocator n=2 Tax=Adonisia turfae TaxID=2950184 RepID=A0A6M0SG52_9CYAN|nr:LysE family translocator [Adonisia turfae]MDV3348150.1 LysE family translocator [Leptothoe sp. LEGE 181152]NEZ60815.1 LysE family translocator [Adonisia turfae CCMR0081]NEZ67539.1 LysE family translocator [Adonisia turfae CCMR0082]